MSRERHPDRWADGALFDRILAETSALPDDSLDTALLRAVQKAFLAKRVSLAWFVAPDHTTWRFQAATRVDGFRADPTPVPTADLLPAGLQAPRPARPMAGQVARSVASVASALDLRLRWPDNGVLVELRCFVDGFVDLPRSTGLQRRDSVVTDLQRSRTGLAEVVQIIRPVRRFAQLRALAQHRQQVEAWLTETRTFELRDVPDLEARAAEASGLVERAAAFLAHPETPDLDRDRIRTAVERVVRTILHHVVCTGWRTLHRGIAADHRDRESRCLTTLLEQLDALPGRPPADHTGPMDVPARLQLLRSVLAAAAAATAPGPDTLHALLPPEESVPEHDRELRLFAAWAIVHDLAHAQVARGTARADTTQAAWAHTVATTRAWLPGILAAWSTPEPEPAPEAPPSATPRGRDRFHAGAVRTWLQLWFAHHVLPATPPRRASKATWRLRRSLAHVFRESLRSKLYSSSPGYTHRPDLIAAALQDLVDRHVRQDARLDPAHDIRGHLALVGDARHPQGPHFAAGHLRHVLELYIAGHFILSARMEGLPAHFGPRPTVADVLASPKGGHLDQTRRRALLAAWSLAALYHDVGLSLFPEFRPPRDIVTRNDPSVAEGLAGVRRSLRSSGRALATRACADLVDAEVYDPTLDRRLQAWLEAQVEAGRPSHALTGAWYLLRASGLVDRLDRTVRLPAVRAVLLHAAPTHEIDAEHDPIAALLALCDELFDWDPSGTSGAGSVHGHPGAPPRTSRAAALRFPQLRVRPGPDGTLDHTFDLRRAPVTLQPGHPPAWPQVQVTHVHPDHLGQHVFPVWLAVAQNISRLSPGPHGFAPVVEVRGPIPRQVRRSSVESTGSLLEALLHEHPTPWRGDVLAWFEAPFPHAVAAVETDPHTRALIEIRRLFPLGRAITHDDLRQHLGDLRREARQMLLELAHRRDL